MKLLLPGGSGQIGTILAVPTVLLRGGFDFQFPTWPEAAANLVSRSR
jgi:hypothetical protein